MRKNIFRGVVMFIVLILSSITAQAQDQPAGPTLKIGDKAPGLKVAKWFKGNPVKGFEAGKIYVVEFWATWCNPCIAGMPHLSDLADKYREDITIMGVSIMERGDDILSRVENFVQKSTDKMRYLVAADSANYMRDNWLYGAGERGIPYSFIVDKNGVVAWCGYPKSLDRVLPLIIAGKWDVKQAGIDRVESKRLEKIDGNDVVKRMNPFMGNPGNLPGAIAEIEKILSENPGLKYYPKLGHFTFWVLIKTDPDKALQFAREWFDASDFPSWKTVTDAVSNMVGRGVVLPKNIYELGAESFQAQIDNYPWSMNMPVTYSEIAKLQFLAGNIEKAAAAQRKAIEEAKKSTTLSAPELLKYEEDLKKYMK